MAQSAGSDKDQIMAIKDIVQNCTFGKLDANTIPFYDLEYVFLQLRAKSVGETAKLQITCPDDGETKVQVDINLSEVECVKDVSHNDKIDLGNGIGMIMTYPKIEIMANAAGGDTEKAFDVVKACIGSIYDGENITDRKDMDERELDEFINSMTHDQFEKMQEFFTSMPRVKKELKVKNPKTGVENNVVLEGMASFF